VLIVALVPRLLFIALGPAPPVRSDASGYDAAARRLVATGTYAFPVGRALWSDDIVREDAWATYLGMPANAWAMPGYSVLLAGIYRLTGMGPGRLAIVRVVQAVLGVAMVMLVFHIADLLLGRRAAWAATIANALYPPSLSLAGYLLTETLFMVLLAGQIAAMAWAADSRRVRAYALLGGLTAAAVYVRPVAAFVPLLLPALEVHRALGDRGARRALGRHALRFAVCAAVTVALLAPWWLRNARIYGVFMPTNSAAALPAIQGELMAHGLAVPDETYAQFALPALAGNDDHVYAEKVARRILEVSPLASRPGVAAGQLGRARMLGPALLSPFRFDSRPYPWTSWPVAMQSAILCLAAFAWWRHRRRLEVSWLVMGVALYILLVHWQVGLLTPRYLYPMMPLLLMLAGAGVADLLPGRGAPRGGRPR
jgi:4-amino-4-deoxy-L-arabinose transferase-like glycosyltransferase